METPVVHLRLPYVVEDRDRHGNVRIYVRKPGCRKVRIKATPGTEAFARAYEAALAAVPPPKAGEAPAGSLRALCAAYYASPVYAALDTSTRKWRRRALDRVCASDGAGGLPVALLEPRHIKQLRDEIAATPGAANQRLKALKALFAWAMEADKASRNPAREVAKIAYFSEGHHSWTLPEVEAFEAAHPIGTKARLALALLLYTAGRREDAVRFGPANLQNGRIRFRQAKNEHRNPIDVDIPLHPDLAAVLAGTTLCGTRTFLVTDYGKPFAPGGFGNRFREWCDQAGLSHCSAHGLRKAFAARLAEHGATDREIMSWTGHETAEEVSRYTRAAGKARRADNAMRKLLAVGQSPEKAE